MKSRLIALNPIKIENRLVPKREFETNTVNGTQQRQSSQPLTSRKIQIVERTIGQRPISPILLKRNTEPDKHDTIRVTIHRSNSIRSQSGQSETSEKMSSNGSDLELSPSYAQPQNDILKTPNKHSVTVDNQISMPLKTVTQSISSEYYHEIDNRINNGIKKLHQMDKRLNAYDNRQTDSSKLIQNKQKQLTNFKESVQLKQTITAMNRKKEEYLQQILTKTRKIKQLQGLAAEREKKLIELEGQIKLFNIKVNRLQDNSKRHAQETESYKQNMAQLIVQINNLKKQIEQNKIQNDQEKILLGLKFEQKTKQINFRNNQYMNTIKINFQEKQAKILKQILEHKQASDKIINLLKIQKQTDIIKIRKQYQQNIRLMKTENERIILNLTQNWALQKTSILNQKQKQLTLQKQQYLKTISELHRKINQDVQQIKEIRKILQQKIQQTKAKIQQGSNNQIKIQQNYKSQYKKLQSKYKDEIDNKAQIQQQMINLRQQTQVLKIQIKSQKVVIKTLADQLDDKKVLYEVECKKAKSSQQDYLKQNYILKEQNKQLNQNNKDLEKRIIILKGEILSLNSQTKNTNMLQIKLKQLEQQNNLYIDKAINLTNKLNISQQKQQMLSIKMSQIQQKLITSNNLLNKLKQKHTDEIKQMKDEFDTKSKQIFQKLTDYYQQKVRLNQQISTYKSKIQQKQQQLNQQGYKMHEIQNLIKNKEKQVLINMVQYEKLNKQLTNYQNNTKQLEEVVKKYLVQFIKINKQIGLNMFKEKSQTQGKDDNIGTGIGIGIGIGIQDIGTDLKGNNLVIQILKIIFAQNKRIVEGYQIIQKQNKKIKSNIPEKDRNKIIEKQELKTQKIQKPLKLFNDVSILTQNITQDKNIQTILKQLSDNVCQTENQVSINKKSIFSEIIKIQIQNITQNSQKIEVIQSKQLNNVETMTDNQSQLNKKVSEIKQLQYQNNYQQLRINNEGLLMQINILKDQISQKENVIEVMQSCIEDYKEMVTQMKYKLQIQQIIQIKYDQILDFFEIDPQKSDEEAHEELIQLINVMMNKLQKTVESVKQLENQLIKANDENLSLKQKKRKIVREIKKYQQMIDRVCNENQQLKLKMFEMGDRIDRDHHYIKQLLKLINDNNQENIRSNFTLLNFKLMKYKMMDDELDQETQQSKLFQESRDQNILSCKQDKTQYQWSQTRIQNNFDQDTASISQIFNKKSRMLFQEKQIKKFQLIQQKQNSILEQEINQPQDTQNPTKQQQNLEKTDKIEQIEETEEIEAENGLQNEARQEQKLIQLNTE